MSKSETNSKHQIPSTKENDKLRNEKRQNETANGNSKRQRQTEQKTVRSQAILIALAAALLVGARAAEKADEAREPPQIFYIESGGKKIPIELDKPVRTETLGLGETAILRVEPYREFKFAGIYFHYPREYTFEAKLETTWTLSGANFTIIINRFTGITDHVEMRRGVEKGIVEGHAGFKLKTSEVSWKLKDTTQTGTRLEMPHVQQDLYSLVAGGDTIIMILQDTPADGGQPSADRVRAEKMLYETLRLPDTAGK